MKVNKNSYSRNYCFNREWVVAPRGEKLKFELAFNIKAPLGFDYICGLRPEAQGIMQIGKGAVVVRPSSSVSPSVVRPLWSSTTGLFCVSWRTVHSLCQFHRTS